MKDRPGLQAEAAYKLKLEMPNFDTKCTET